MSVDFPDWQQPQAIADHISITGAPLLRLTTPLVSATNQNVGPQSNIFPLTNMPVDQPSYEASFTASLPAASGTVPFVQIQLQWINFATGLLSDVETFFMPAGNGVSNSITCYLSGPCRGSALSVAILNLDPAQNLTLSYDINATSHVYVHDRLFQSAYATTAPNGFTNPDGVPTSGVLVATQPTVGPNTSAFRLVACWSGRVMLGMNNAGLANAVVCVLHDPASLYSGFTQFGLQRFQVAAGAQFVQETALPNGPVLMEIRNTGSTGNTTTAISLVKVEY
jgi:hypothetical protein